MYMTENTNEPVEFTEADAVSEDAESLVQEPRYDNVRAYRHAATGALSRGREVLSLRTDKTHEVYSLINGVISEILRGRKGLTVEEQVAHLDDALVKVEEALEALPEKIAAAKESIVAALDAWEETIMSEASAARKVLREGKEYAATRDFEAHQAAKHERGGYSAFADPEAPSSDSADEESEDDGGW